MNLQVIQGGNGKATGVFIPIKDWEVLKKQYQIADLSLDAEPTKAEILAGIRQGVLEMKLIKAGKLKGRPARELLNEL